MIEPVGFQKSTPDPEDSSPFCGFYGMIDGLLFGAVVGDDEDILSYKRFRTGSWTY